MSGYPASLRAVRDGLPSAARHELDVAVIRWGVRTVLAALAWEPGLDVIRNTLIRSWLDSTASLTIALLLDRDVRSVRRAAFCADLPACGECDRIVPNLCPTTELCPRCLKRREARIGAALARVRRTNREATRQGRLFLEAEARLG